MKNFRRFFDKQSETKVSRSNFTPKIHKEVRAAKYHNFKLAFFGPRKVNLKIPVSSWSEEDSFRLLDSSNPLLRFLLVMSRDLANLGKSIHQDLAILGKSSSGICSFSVSHLLGLDQFWQVIFRNCWVGKNEVADF